MKKNWNRDEEISIKKWKSRYLFSMSGNILFEGLEILGKQRIEEKNKDLKQ